MSSKCVLNRVFLELRNLKKEKGNLQERDRILGRLVYVVMLNLTKAFGFRQT